MKHFRALSVLLSLVAIGWGANQFAPLVVMYETTSGIGAAAVQSMFVVYAVGLVPGLFIGGPLSDRHGRRAVVVWSLIISGISSGLLMVGSAETEWLYVGRLLAGVASGAGFSAGTAWTKEISLGSTGARNAVIAMTAGFAMGPLVAGLISAFSPLPELVVYFPHLAVTFVAVILAISSPANAGSTPFLAPTLSSERTRRRQAMVRDPKFVWLIMPLAPWVFLTASVALAVLPGAGTPARGGGDALLFSAIVTPIPAVAGIVVQPLTRRLNGHLRLQILIGLGCAAAGLVLSAWTAAERSLVGTVVAAAVLGCAYGMCQTVGLQEVVGLSSPEHLGRNTAVYQALTYLGYIAPLPIVLLTRWIPLQAVLLALSIAAIVVALLICLNLRRTAA